jgi:hypothetical protein
LYKSSAAPGEQNTGLDVKTKIMLNKIPKHGLDFIIMPIIKLG